MLGGDARCWEVEAECGVDTELTKPPESLMPDRNFAVRTFAAGAAIVLSGSAVLLAPPILPPDNLPVL